mmetsp:Transcript_13394/g.20188  ORF Transcript_13394/g.20188 Transcript_13394/m.20188 type:complete len:465 (+) Transcript_13394:3-1397(+)
MGYDHNQNPLFIAMENAPTSPPISLKKTTTSAFSRKGSVNDLLATGSSLKRTVKSSKSQGSLFDEIKKEQKKLSSGAACSSNALDPPQHFSSDDQQLDGSSDFVAQPVVVSHTRALVITCFPVAHAINGEYWIILPNPIADLREALLQELPSDMDILTKLKPVPNGLLSSVKNDLLDFERKTKRPCYKFGLLYCRENQYTEYEMYHNQVSDGISDDFSTFLDFIGDTVPLDQHKGYHGGLDVKGGSTGTHSQYTTYQNLQIMFHVATMIPYTPNDQYQLARKRFIGNDVVVIIFRDAPLQQQQASSSWSTNVQPIDVTKFESQFNHVFVVVQVDREITKQTGTTHYRLAIASKDGEHSFAPIIPNPPVFKKDERFRNFFFTKLINSERAAMYAPGFASKLHTTSRALLNEIAATYTHKVGLKKPKRKQQPERKKKLSKDFTQAALIKKQMKEKKKKKKKINSTT